MKIDSCKFGSIVIDGRKYTSDLIIYPDGRVETSWRRRFGHRLSGDDIDELIASGPDVIVAGTGLSGLVKPEEKLEELLHNMAIEFFPAPNQPALEIYNELSTKKKVGACFHLTC